MKTKIEIKSIFGQILFEYEGENNTIKDTVQEAVNRGVSLCGADLCGDNLRDANLDDVNLCGANLCGADLGQANLRDANLGNANLCGANLRDANLGGANLRDANLGGADLGNAHLCGAHLCGVNLRGAHLCGADLCGANLCSAHLRDADLGNWGNLRGSSDILTIGTIGSRNSYTTIYHTDKGIFVQCGCFSGTLDEFVAQVKEKHQGNKHERDYLALVEFAKIKFEL